MHFGSRTVSVSDLGGRTPTQAMFAVYTDPTSALQAAESGQSALGFSAVQGSFVLAEADEGQLGPSFAEPGYWSEYVAP